MIKAEVQDGTTIEVVGVGDVGGSAVQRMTSRNVQGVEFIYMNTDTQALKHSTASRVLQFGSTGLGAGVKPEVGKHYAEEARERVADTLRGTHMVSITAGMGGGTGIGAAPVVAQIAKEMGTLTMGVVSKPFDSEGTHRLRVDKYGANDLEGNVDSLIVVFNEKLFEVMGDDAGMDRCFQCTDDVLHNMVTGIAEIINVDGLVNVDFENVKTAMDEQGEAMMDTTTVSGVDRARLAAEQAMTDPLLEGVGLSGARGVLVNITASHPLKLSETKGVMSTVRGYATEDVTVIFGTIYDDVMGNALRVTMVATGLGRAARNKQQQPQTMTLLETGTNNRPMTFGGDAGHSVAMAPDCSSFDIPAVWRNSHESASAYVAALRERGVDTYDIPVFLRKQAD